MNMKSDTKQVRLAEIMGNALRYWEMRRLAYNGALILVALGWLIATWPHFFRSAINLRDAGALCALVILANLCYSVVYLIDVPAQYSPARLVWLRWRWLVLLLGILFALLLENYWIADEIY